MKQLLIALSFVLVGVSASEARYYTPPPTTTMVTTVYVPMIVAAGTMSYQKSEVSPQTRDATNKATYGVSNVNEEDNMFLALAAVVFFFSFIFWSFR